MSVQIFLQGKLLGIDEFLLSPTAGDHERVFAGRSHWVTLIGEVLPRALLAELGLSKILLGSSGGGQFLVVLPEEVRGQAGEFLKAAAAQIGSMSAGYLKLVWAVTENLGDWSDVRKRLNEEMQRRRGAPGAGLDSTFFDTVPAPEAATEEDYFANQLGLKLREAGEVGWSPEEPGKFATGPSKHSWSVTTTADALPIARHAAPSEDGLQPADSGTLAARSAGYPIWGVLRGDVDNFGIRLRRVQTIEEHIQLSVLYKQFFAGELEVLCSMGEFWRKVTVLYSGGNDFAIYGSWDALIGVAREMQRLFRRFSEENLKDFPGPEGKTITMAISLAPAVDASLASVFEEAGHKLEMAKSTDKDCIYLLGRTLEWKQFADSAELKDNLTQMVTGFGCSPQYLRDLCGIYREGTPKSGSKRQRRAETDRPWRFHRRLNRILGTSRDREFQKAKTTLISDLIGRGGGHLKLRPSGRVALEWARLSVE